MIDAPRPLVELRDLKLSFDTVDGIQQVIQNVTLEIRPGEIVGLVGETGCGKSVTAKLLLGILPMQPARIESGSATLFGEDLATISVRKREALKRSIAYVPQDPMAALNPSFTIGAQMLDTIVWERADRKISRYLMKRRSSRIRREALAQAAALLAGLHISDPVDVLGCYPAQLSGGMRQRVLLALAMSGSPQLLVADEPTTALDVTVQKRTVQLIRELVEWKQLAGLYITHDLGLARSICNRTYVMYGGATVEHGPTAELLEHPRHPYTEGLVNSIPRLAGDLPLGIPGQIPNYLSPPQGCRFAPRCPHSFSACGSLPATVHLAPNRGVACALRGGTGLAI